MKEKGGQSTEFPPLRARSKQRRVKRLPVDALRVAPRSYGLTLRTMRYLADLSLAKQATLLMENKGRFGKSAKLYPQQLSKLEWSETNLLNWHLEAYQNWTGFPTSVLDLIAHLGAEIRDGNLAEAKKIAASVREFCAAVETNAPALARKFDRPVKATLEKVRGADVSATKTVTQLCMNYLDDMARRDERPSMSQQLADMRFICIAMALLKMFCQAQDQPVAFIRPTPLT